MERLKGPQNYQAWLMDLEVSLACSDVREHIGEDPPPKPSDPDELEKWEDKDNLAKMIVVQTVSADIKADVHRSGWRVEQTAQKTFQAIQKTVLDLAETSFMNTTIEFWTLDAASFQTLKAYSKRLNFLWAHLLTVTPTIDERYFVIKAIDGLKKAYPVWYSHWKHDFQMDKEPTKDTINNWLHNKA